MKQEKDVANTFLQRIFQDSREVFSTNQTKKTAVFNYSSKFVHISPFASCANGLVKIQRYNHLIQKSISSLG